MNKPVFFCDNIANCNFTKQVFRKKIGEDFLFGKQSMANSRYDFRHPNKSSIGLGAPGNLSKVITVPLSILYYIHAIIL